MYPLPSLNPTKYTQNKINLLKSNKISIVVFFYFINRMYLKQENPQILADVRVRLPRIILLACAISLKKCCFCDNQNSYLITIVDKCK